MTVQADFVCGLSQLCVVRGAVHIVTTETGDSATVHYTLHEVVALHTILVRVDSSDYDCFGESRRFLPLSPGFVRNGTVLTLH